MRSPRVVELGELLVAAGAVVTGTAHDIIEVSGPEAWWIGDLAAERGIPLHELTPTSGSLEDAYLALTGDAVEYRTRAVPEAGAPIPEVVA